MRIIRKVISVELNVEDLRREISSKIRELRKKKNFSQEELAVACGLSRPSIGNIEKGRQNIAIEHLYKICILMEINITELLPNLEIEEPHAPR